MGVIVFSNISIFVKWRFTHRDNWVCLTTRPTPRHTHIHSLFRIAKSLPEKSVQSFDNDIHIQTEKNTLFISVYFATIGRRNHILPFLVAKLLYNFKCSSVPVFSRLSSIKKIFYSIFIYTIILSVRMFVIASLGNGIQDIYLNFAVFLKDKIDPLFCMKFN